MAGELVDVLAAARLVGHPWKAVARWRLEGQLPAESRVVRGRRRWMYRPADVRRAAEIAEMDEKQSRIRARVLEANDMVRRRAAGSGMLPDRPCYHRPGSPERIAEYARRAAMGCVTVFHPLDVRATFVLSEVA